MHEQERAEHEDQERRSLSSSSASSPSASRTLNGAPAALGGVCGSASENDPHHHRRAGGQAHRERQRVGVQHLADHDAGHDPADGAEHADDRKIARRVLRRGGTRPSWSATASACSRARRGSAADRTRRRSVCVDTHHMSDGAAEVQQRQQLFGGEEAVGDHAQEERRHQRRDRGGAVRQADSARR